ncbi:ATP-binding protein [Ruminococcus sp.]|uniref:ATP-binding protein n=1 Tax=Ruminococcus sp. TaxID=41978 RepID=UPI0025E52EFE|nr:ATP-binding protein [Ruminococcus sp.]MBR1433344.1 ATP-binding protein [Ruminococcus sp.]
MENIQITSDGIKKNLKRIKPYNAICEYIWNGFDAGATQIEIIFEFNQIENVSSITIIDNGNGINYDELSLKFKPFNDSEKATDNNNSHHSIPHGKHGIGRFTFFTFASKAQWYTVYKDENAVNKAYSINMNCQSLNSYDVNNNNLPVVVQEETGTKVEFINVYDICPDALLKEIKNEFFWFICLYSYKNYRIYFNNEIIDFSDYIRERFNFKYESEQIKDFNITITLWNCSLGKEYSKFYFINSTGDEVYKFNTTLNNKSDGFWHSITIKSKYFNDFYFEVNSDDEINFSSNRNDKDFKELIQKITDELIRKRRSYLKKASEKYISSLIDENVYPNFEETNILDKYRRSQLDAIIESLYQAEPQIFSGLNNPQKKIFIRLLNTIMDSNDNEKEALFSLIREIIDLDEEDQKNFNEILQKTTLTNIISTIRLLEDRLAAVQALKEVVFNKKFNSYEVKHVQAIVERHFWLFGEQYHLLTAAEPDFNVALRELLAFKGKQNKTAKIDSKDANKEMDIYLIRQNRESQCFENIVVELKRPIVPLGEEQLSQVKRYMRVIKSDSRFNSPDSKWTFILVGNRFDSTGYIEGELENNKNHGESGLVYESGNHKIYVKTWSQIFEDFSVKNEYLLKKLKFKQEMWLEKHNSADEAVNDAVNNTAAV